MIDPENARDPEYLEGLKAMHLMADPHDLDLFETRQAEITAEIETNKDYLSGLLRAARGNATQVIMLIQLTAALPVWQRAVFEQTKIAEASGEDADKYGAFMLWKVLEFAQAMHKQSLIELEKNQDQIADYLSGKPKFDFGE